jgi:hypothetical protein
MSQVKSYPELREIAHKIVRATCEQINKEVLTVNSKMPYKAQFEVVRELQDRI